MSGGLKENWLEAAVGLAVILVAAWFVSFAASRTSGAVGSESYELLARFPNVNGIAPGADVRVSGLKVGTVSTIKLNPESYQAEARMTIDKSVKLPADSSAAITSAGLLGGSYVALLPGGDTTFLKGGDEITDTQGAADLMGLIGSFMNRSGGDSSPAAAAPAAAAEPGARAPAP